MEANAGPKMTMDSTRWKYFRITFVVCILTMGLIIYDQGGFDSVTTYGAIGIMILAIVAIGFGIYRFVKSLDDPDQPLG
jgi:hypothetical protein